MVPGVCCLLLSLCVALLLMSVVVVVRCLVCNVSCLGCRFVLKRYSLLFVGYWKGMLLVVGCLFVACWCCFDGVLRWLSLLCVV